MPPEELFAAMATYHEALQKAGMLLDASGCSRATRAGASSIPAQEDVVDGPFAETKELIAATRSSRPSRAKRRWNGTKRFPNPHLIEGEIEVRQLFELEDFEQSPSIERFREMDAIAKQ